MCKNVTYFISVTQFDFLTLESYDRQLNPDIFQVALFKSSGFQSIQVWNTIVVRMFPICLLLWPHPSVGYSRGKRMSMTEGTLCVRQIWMGSRLASQGILMPLPSQVPGTGGPSSLDSYWKPFTPRYAGQCLWQVPESFSPLISSYLGPLGSSISLPTSPERR